MRIDDILERIDNILDEICQQNDPIDKIRDIIRFIDQLIYHYPQYKSAYYGRGMAKVKLSQIVPATENPGVIFFDGLHDLKMS